MERGLRQGSSRRSILHRQKKGAKGGAPIARISYSAVAVPVSFKAILAWVSVFFSLFLSDLDRRPEFLAPPSLRTSVDFGSLCFKIYQRKGKFVNILYLALGIIL